MFDPIIADIEPLDIYNSDLDLAVYHELKEDDTVVLVDRWKRFYEDFYDGPSERFKQDFNKFCKHWKRHNRAGFTFPGIKACTLLGNRRITNETKYDPSGIVPEQEVGTFLFPCRLTKEAEYEMHHDYSEEEARRFEYTGPWVSALMVQAKMERQERYESTISWLTRHQDKLSAMASGGREHYLQQIYKAFWRAYFKAQRANIAKSYGNQSKPLTILQRMDIKHQFQFLADMFGVNLEIMWPEGDGPRTLPDILQEKKQQLSVLHDSGNMKDLARSEDLEREIENLESRIRVDESVLTPWIAEYMTGRERDRNISDADTS
jgi:hypothetical protein